MKFEGQKFICLDPEERNEMGELAVESYLEEGWVRWDKCRIGGVRKIWLTSMGEIKIIATKLDGEWGDWWSFEGDDFWDNLDYEPFVW